ncbi:MAG: Ku protein [bacterium]|nr:Ku protein [bacterium]
MPRAIWSGHLTFGLVSIPVGLHAAVESSQEVHFRLLHRKDKAPIRYKKFCSKEDTEVPADEIVRGYETSKGRWAVVEKEELDEVQAELGEGEHTIELLQFIAADTLDPLLLERPYYLGAERGGDKAYVVLREALAESGRVGVARVYLRTRPHLAAVLPVGDVLAVVALREPGSLRTRTPFAPRRATARPNEKKMAKTLIDEMGGDFDPMAHPNRYRKAVDALVRAKPQFVLGEAETADAGTRRKGAPVVDLMEALKRSLAASAGGKRRRRASAREKAA